MRLSSEFIFCILRNQFLGEYYTIFLAFCIILGFKQLQNLPGGVIMLLSHLRPRHSGPRAAKDQNDSAKGAIILQYHPLKYQPLYTIMSTSL